MKTWSAGLYLAWSFVLPVHALTLVEAHKIAVQKAEKIAQSEESLRAAQADYKRRLSVVFPTLSVAASELIQDVPGTSSTNEVLNSFVRRSTPDVALQAQYYLFTGFREYAGLDVGKAFVRQKTSEKDWSVQLLYAEVARSFFGVIRAEQGIRLADRRDKVLQDRVSELRRFEKIGRSRLSERLTVQADLQRLKADYETLRGELVAQKSILEFWVGDAANMPLQDNARDALSIPPVEECLKDVPARPDLNGYREAVVGLERQVDFEQGEYWPTIDLKAHYYPYTVGFRDQIDWDVGFYLNYDFFQGGLTKASVAKARAQQREAEYRLKEAERQAELEVKTKHVNVQTSVGRFKALKEAVSLSDQNYTLQSKEYRLGLVTNLDVLSALNRLHETEWDMEKTRYDALIQLADLTAARGKAPKEEPSE